MSTEGRSGLTPETVTSTINGVKAQYKVIREAFTESFKTSFLDNIAKGWFSKDAKSAMETTVTNVNNILDSLDTLFPSLVKQMSNSASYYLAIEGMTYESVSLTAETDKLTNPGLEAAEDGFVGIDDTYFSMAQNALPRIDGLVENQVRMLINRVENCGFSSPGVQTALTDLATKVSNDWNKTYKTISDDIVKALNDKQAAHREADTSVKSGFTLQ